MQPLIGDTVIVFIHPDYNNGADEAPAVICRAWPDENTTAPGEALVNVRVFLDDLDVPWLTSVPLHPTRAAAEAAHAEKWAHILVPAARPFPHGAWWPPHQPGGRPPRH